MRNTHGALRTNLVKLALLLLIVLLTHIATTEVWMIVNSTGADVPIGCDSYALPWDLGAIPWIALHADEYCNS